MYHRHADGVNEYSAPRTSTQSYFLQVSEVSQHPRCDSIAARKHGSKAKKKKNQCTKQTNSGSVPAKATSHDHYKCIASKKQIALPSTSTSTRQCILSTNANMRTHSRIESGNAKRRSTGRNKEDLRLHAVRTVEIIGFESCNLWR